MECRRHILIGILGSFAIHAVGSPVRPASGICHQSLLATAAEAPAHREARIYATAKTMIHAEERLSDLMELAPVPEGAKRIDWFNFEDPERSLALEGMAKSRRLLSRCCNIGQDLVKDVLLQTLEPPRVYWDAHKKKIFLQNLVITAEQLQDDQLSTVEPVGTGQLMIGHRPRLKSMADFKTAGFTHIVTVLAESEDARRIGQKVEQNQMAWLWLPMGSAAATAEPLEVQKIWDFTRGLVPLFRGEHPAKIYLHCSAGMHRTGMITYLVLRLLGYSSLDALNKIGRLRPVTLSEMTRARLEWAEGLLARQPL